MKILKIGLISAAFALFIFACNQAVNNTANNAASNANTNTTSTTQSATPLDELASGKNIYTEKCVKCHKADGTGGTIEILGEKREAADFTAEIHKKHTDEKMLGNIRDGIDGEGMPAFKNKLTEQEMKNVLKYIRTEFQPK